jgi:hypothetical protein
MCSLLASSMATTVEAQRLSRCRNALVLNNGFVDSPSPLKRSQVQRLPMRKESHQKHGGVEPCSGHLNTCCKVSFSTTDPSSLKSRLSTESAESRRLRGNMAEVSMASGCSSSILLSACGEERDAEYDSARKSGTKNACICTFAIGRIVRIFLVQQGSLRSAALASCMRTHLCDGHVFVASIKDERIEAPGWDGRCRKCMADRLDCMTALVYGRLASCQLHAIVGLRFLGR